MFILAYFGLHGKGVWRNATYKNALTALLFADRFDIIIVNCVHCEQEGKPR